MGFGVLLFGYFLTFAFSLSEVYFFTDVIGSLIMLWAFTKLMQYNRYYRGAAVVGCLFTFLCLTGGFGILMQIRAEWWTILLNCLKTAVACALHVLILLGIRGIASGADCAAIAQKALRNLVVTVFYYVLYYVILVTSPLYPDIVSYVSFVVYLYWFVAFLFNLALFYHCFGLLYPADGDPMAQEKKSRFSFINKLNEKFDQLQDKSNAYRRESMEMALEEAKKRSESKKTHKNKKKKK